LPRRPYLSLSDIHPDRLSKIFLSTYERKPKNFESLLGLEGVAVKLTYNYRITNIGQQQNDQF